MKKEKLIEDDYPLVGSKIDVYYWKNNKWLFIGYDVKHLPTETEFKRDYKKLPISLSFNNMITIGANLNNVYEILNIKNPMETQKNQEWIRKNLQPHPHTSMSVGDIVKIRGEYWMVMSVGWKKLKWK